MSTYQTCGIISDNTKSIEFKCNICLLLLAKLACQKNNTHVTYGDDKLNIH